MNCTHGTPTTTHCPPCADLVAQFTAHMDHLDTVYGRDTSHLACLPDCPECGDRGFLAPPPADPENGPSSDDIPDFCTCRAGLARMDIQLLVEGAINRGMPADDALWYAEVNGREELADYIAAHEPEDRDDFPMELEYDDQYESGAYESI